MMERAELPVHKNKKLGIETTTRQPLATTTC